MWLALLLFWLFSLVLWGAAIGQTAGSFGYPLDDTYIHMAIGKHFALNGIWGISSSGFSSSTSSPLWTLLIGLGYRLFGVNAWLPAVLGLLSGSFTIILLFALLKQIRDSLRLTLFLVGILLFAPLPILALSGMEHTLHALLTVWLLYTVLPLADDGEVPPQQVALMLILAGLLTMTRYEGLFLIFAVSLLLLFLKRFVLAVLVGAAGFLPVLVYGLYSVRQGWYFLPNSILLKGKIPDPSMQGVLGLLFQIPSALSKAPHISLLLVACLVVYLWGEERKLVGRRERVLIALFAVITFLHLQFASLGWFYRYEAYLVLTGSVILADLMNLLMSSSPQNVQGRGPVSYVAVAILGFLVILPLAVRTGFAFRDYPLAVMNIHEQQVQIGLFVKQNYTGKSIAANDIGAISYLADVALLDLFGLGSLDVAEAKRDDVFDREKIDELVQHHEVDLVVIYNSWFEDKIPASWVEIGQWQISNNVISSSDTVSFYAPTPAQQSTIIGQLQDFSSQLPADVAQFGLYQTP
jgi:hypothetical protein